MKVRSTAAVVYPSTGDTLPARVIVEVDSNDPHVQAFLRAETLVPEGRDAVREWALLRRSPRGAHDST